MAVQKRSFGYVSRTVVPGDLRLAVRRREIVRSLGTGSSREAHHRAAEFEGRVAALFRRLRHDGPMLDHDQIDALVAQYLDAELRDADERLSNGAWTTNRNAAQALGEDWPSFGASLLADRAEELQEALTFNRLKDALPEAAKLLPRATEETLQVLARRLLEAKHEATVAEMRALQGEPLPRIVTATALREAPKTSPLLADMVESYATFKQAGKKWTPKTAKQLRNLFRVMIELIGDKPVREVTKDDMRELYRLMPQMPAHAPKRYPGMTAMDAIAAADADGQDERLSPKTQNDYYVHIKSLFKWAVENDYLDKSPAVVLKDVDESSSAWDKRPAFTDGQLVKYFKVLRDESQAAALWVPRLMLYAGLRTEEAAKLTPEDIREEQGIVVLDINRRTGRLKTGNADRLVPVHSAILAELLRYTEGQPRGTNLWGLSQNANGTFSSALSKRLNRVLDIACPEDDRLVAYCLRHTFATRLKDADVQQFAISELLGHGVEELSVGWYGKRLSVERLRESVEKLKMPAVL